MKQRGNEHGSRRLHEEEQKKKKRIVAKEYRFVLRYGRINCFLKGSRRPASEFPSWPESRFRQAVSSQQTDRLASRLKHPGF